jgi:hypothetical protein
MVFPAQAGMNRCGQLMLTVRLGVPRACGDEPIPIIDLGHPGRGQGRGNASRR